MKKPIHQVSDHALLRYLERAQGVDVEGLRRDLGRRIDAAVGRMDCDLRLLDISAAHIDGLTFLVKGRIVVTVMNRKVSNTTRPE